MCVIGRGECFWSRPVVYDSVSSPDTVSTMLRHLRYLGGGGVRWNMRRHARHFLKLTRAGRAVQQQTLLRLIALNQESDFGRAHHFREIRNARDFRERLPISDFEYFRPYVERLKNGEHSALLGPQNQLRMFALTSGTSAASKFIPITETFLNDYRRGWKIWGIRAFDDHPRLHTQDILQLTSDYDQFATPGGHPCGNISGLVSAMQSPLVQSMYCIPQPVVKIRNPEAKYYAALRFAVANPHVGMITTANPSTLVHLAKLADRFKAELIRDIADGTLSAQFEIPAEVRQRLHRQSSRPDPVRARQLEQFVHHRGCLSPRDYWSEASLLAVWTGGSAAAYLPNLERFYGNLPIRDHGLSASEGRMTIPLQDNSPTGILDIGTHYFEFIPEEEAEQWQPTVLEAHELVPDRNYFILLTTSSGLCRYNIRDVVRCTGYLNETPLMEFLNKGAHICSLTGEKITESQVVAAVREALREIPVNLSYFTVASRWGDPPEYCILAEAGDFRDPLVPSRFAAQVDLHLQRINCEYGEKRQTGRLGALKPYIIPSGSWQLFTRDRQSKRGGSIEQYKHPCLSPDPKFIEDFERTYTRKTA